MVELKFRVPQVSQKKVVQPKVKPAVQLLPLLSADRERKADLLIHLITNLDQPIIISGPVGIGKTSFLKAIEERKAPLWVMLYLQASAEISFESVLKGIMKVIKKTDIYQGGMTLEQSFKRMETLNYRFVLLINDAALLVPGLLTTLIQYNKSVSVLRVVATLTQQEVFVKTADHTIDDCHVTVIPKLTKRQTIDLITHELENTPGSILAELVSPMVLDKIYRLSRGRPGEIIKLVAKIPKLIMLMKYQKIGYFLAAGCFVFTLFGILMWGDQEEMPSQNAGERSLNKTATSPTTKLKDLDHKPSKSTTLIPTAIPINKPSKKAGFSSKPTSTLAKKSVTTDSELAANSLTDKSLQPHKTKLQSNIKGAHQRLLSAKRDEPLVKQPSSNVVAKPKLIRKEKVALLQTKKARTEQNKTTSAFLYHKNKWALLQDGRKYTLQLMSMNTPPPLLKVANQHSEMSDLNIIKVSADKYILLQGSFRSQKAANIARAHVPTEFSDAWVRSFNDVHKEIEQNSR